MGSCGIQIGRFAVWTGTVPTPMRLGFQSKVGSGGVFPLSWSGKKAARGVDGRWYPWGDGFDPSYACVLESHQDGREPAPISGAIPLTGRSMGSGGWQATCRTGASSHYRKDWTAPLEMTHYVGRGGNWHASQNAARAAHRHLQSDLSQWADWFSLVSGFLSF